MRGSRTCVQLPPPPPDTTGAVDKGARTREDNAVRPGMQPADVLRMRAVSAGVAWQNQSSCCCSGQQSLAPLATSTRLLPAAALLSGDLQTWSSAVLVPSAAPANSAAALPSDSHNAGGCPDAAGRFPLAPNQFKRTHKKNKHGASNSHHLEFAQEQR